MERNYARQPLTAEEIEAIFGQDSIPPFLNTRHAIYKERGFADGLPSRAELIKLIQAEPNLLRRPITRAGNKVVIGFDPAKLTSLIED